MNNEMLIKICGIKTPAIAITAAKLGADFIGLVFDKNSHRYVTMQQAKIICDAIKKMSTKPVGVFTYHSVLQIIKICNYCNIKTIQLHERPAQKNVSKLTSKFNIIYVVNTNYNHNLPLNPQKDYLLFDNSIPGSGKQLPLDNFSYSGNVPFFIAGGLNNKNVLEIIKRAGANGVDVSSGVENKQKEKDEQLIKQFINTVEGYNHANNN